MFKYIISFLVLINPIVTFIYLQPVIKRMKKKDLRRVIASGSLVALIVFCVFALVGNVFFKEVLQVRFDSFRIFGGLIITYYAFAMIAQGRTSLITYDDDHSRLANQIAMPILIGVGTIALSIVIGNKFSPAGSFFVIGVALLINYVTLVMLTMFRDNMVRYFKKDFDTYMEGLLRLFAFFAGAIGIEMIVNGITNIW